MFPYEIPSKHQISQRNKKDIPRIACRKNNFTRYSICKNFKQNMHRTSDRSHEFVENHLGVTSKSHLIFPKDATKLVK